MTAQFNEDVLKAVVAQICQVVGFQAIYTIPTEVLSDLLHRYILKIAISAKRYAEHCGRTEPTMADLVLSFQDIGVSISGLEEYINHVDPFPFPHAIPKLPIPRPSNMNFLKPGSKETLSRPIHIHEHLPPMYPAIEEEDDANLSMNDSFDDEQMGAFNSSLGSSNDKIGEGVDLLKRIRPVDEEEGEPIREIDSVILTTSGFISPAREGKKAEAMKPNIGLASVKRDSSSLKKKATLEKIIRHKSQFAGGQSGTLAKPPRPKEVKLKPKLPGAPPGTGSLKPEKVIPPVLKMPTPKKMEEHVDKVVVEVRKKDEHRHRERKRDRDRNREDKEKYRGRMRMRGLSKEEELRRYRQREQELIAALAASASVTVTSIPPPRLRVREKTPEKGALIKNSPGTCSPDDKLAVFKKVKDFPERLKSPPSLIDIQNIKEEKVDDEYGMTPSTDMGYSIPPFMPETPGKVYMEKQLERLKKPKLKTKVPSTKAPRRHSKGPRRRKNPTAVSKVPDYGNQNPDESALMKSPPREFLTYPNAPSHIPSFSSFSYPTLGAPPADIKPFANVFPDHSFSSPLQMNENLDSIVTPHKESDNFDHSFETESSYMPPQPTPKITASLPKGDKKREHKKDKKSKDRDAEKEKAKKKKKDKERAKEEKRKEKERLKEEKRRKKKEKETIPKLTLKLQPEEPSISQPVEPKATPKLVIKPVVKRPEEVIDKRQHYSFPSQSIDEPGSPPEIAKLTALIMRPKSSNKKHSEPPIKIPPIVPPIKIKDPNKSLHLSDFKKSEKKVRRPKHSSGLPKTPKPPKTPKLVIPPPSPFSPPKSPRTSTPKSKKHSGPSTALIAETVGPIGCFKDDQGNEVWICPTCVKQDDGSPMIGCDACDDWYHWVCMGIQVAPNENVNWYCPRCILHQKQQGGGTHEKKKRGRKRKLS